MINSSQEQMQIQIQSPPRHRLNTASRTLRNSNASQSSYDSQRPPSRTHLSSRSSQNNSSQHGTDEEETSTTETQS